MDCSIYSQQQARRAQRLDRLIGEANSPKDQLMHLESQLRDAGCRRQADSLNRIIARLEAWQHRSR